MNMQYARTFSALLRVLHAADLATGKQLWQLDELPYERGTFGPS